MKIRIRKIVTFLFIISGLLILSYPFISNLLINMYSTQVIKNYDFSVEKLSEEAKQKLWAEAEEYNNMLNGQGIKDPFVPGSGHVLPDNYTSVLNINGVMGYIDIPNIDVYLQIYHGTSEGVLKSGVGHLQNTAFPIGGEGNHTVLTGHRGLPSAKLFTDLDKLEKGDEFYITILGETLAYKIDQIEIVEPSDTKELVPIQNKDYVTLITCTPYGINSHRLLIRGERTEYKIDSDSSKDKYIDYRIIVSVLILVVLLFILWNQRRKKENSRTNENDNLQIINKSNKGKFRTK